MGELVDEFTKQSCQVSLDVVPNEHTGIADYTLVVTIPNYRDFLYQVQAVEAAVPRFDRRMSGAPDLYYRAEVFSQTCSEGYNLMGVTHQQLIDDVLGRYEGHLGFLALSKETG